MRLRYGFAQGHADTYVPHPGQIVTGQHHARVAAEAYRDLMRRLHPDGEYRIRERVAGECWVDMSEWPANVSRALRQHGEKSLDELTRRDDVVVKRD